MATPLVAPPPQAPPGATEASIAAELQRWPTPPPGEASLELVEQAWPLTLTLALTLTLTLPLTLTRTRTLPLTLPRPDPHPHPHPTPTPKQVWPLYPDLSIWLDEMTAKYSFAEAGETLRHRSNPSPETRRHHSIPNPNPSPNLTLTLTR